MMNNLYKLIFIFTLFLFTACEAEDSFDGNLVSAIFSPGFAGGIESDIDPNMEPGTRANNNTWTSGDRVGIYMLDGSNYTLSTALKSNVEYQAGSTSTSVTLTPVSTANTIYYPVNGNTVRFVGYSPYNSSATNNNQVTYTFTTQNTKATKESKDFIFYRGTTDRSKTNATENMTFKHKFSKINIIVKQGTGGPSCNGLTMTLTKMPVSATVNLATLASSATNENAIAGLGISTSSTTISPYTSSSAATSASVETIVAPHTGSGNFTGRTFTFSTGGVNYTYSLANTVQFESGKIYNFEFTLTQTEAVLTNSTITNWADGEVQWNKNYALTASLGLLNFDYTSSTQTVTIRTKGTAKKPTSSRSTSATTIAGSPTWITTYSLGTGTTSGDWTSYPLTVTVSANNTTANSRTPAYIHLDVEGLKVVIAVNQSGVPGAPAASVDNMSNCYIIAPNGTVTFPVTRAYTGGVLRSDYNSTFTVEKLWDDNGVISTATVSGSGTAAKVTINATAYQGNALIALRAGGIVWSYHIWVVNINLNNTWDPKNSGGSTTNPRTTFMDRNLGATDNTLSVESRGLFYQWGRKDPFPKTDIAGFYYQTNTGPIALEESVRTPNVFITNSTNSSNWLDESNNYLWVTMSNQKTIYDPCPIGWRVPVSDTESIFPWYGLEISRYDPDRTGGNQIGTSSWPAVGNRSEITGIAQTPGYSGYYYTSSADSNTTGKSWELRPQNYGMIYSAVTVKRAVGGSVRCVKDI